MGEASLSVPFEFGKEKNRSEHFSSAKRHGDVYRNVIDRNAIDQNAIDRNAIDRNAID